MFRYLLFAIFIIVCACQKSQEVVFETLYNDPNVSWKSITIQDNQIYIAGGNEWESGIVMRSDDEGNTWDIELESTSGFLAIDSYEGGLFTAGFNSNFYVKSADNWVDKTISQASIIRGVAQNEQVLIAVGGQAYFEGYVYSTAVEETFTTRDSLDSEISDVAHVKESIFMSVGYGSVYRSEDNGLSWNRLDVEGDFFRKIQFVNEQVGYIVGFAGQVMHTSDGGISWEEIRNGQSLTGGIQQIRSIYFDDNSRGLIAGDNGKIQLTENNGDSWVAIEGLPDEDYNDVILYENKVILISEQGSIYSFDLN
jgi:photosystem II stability/assembly factor-like uncharacterized protein